VARSEGLSSTMSWSSRGVDGRVKTRGFRGRVGVSVNRCGAESRRENGLGLKTEGLSSFLVLFGVIFPPPMVSTCTCTVPGPLDM
jgi:hypothetical protein